MDDSKKDNIWGCEEKICYCEWRGKYGLNKVIKVKSILSSDILEKRRLEVRINI